MSAPDVLGPGWRVRAMRRSMSFDKFQRAVPVRPGWKREYYGGMARVRPSWTGVIFELDLIPRPMSRARGMRPVVPGDAAILNAAFLDSFRFAPEYAAYPMSGFRTQASEYVKGFFGDARGAW